MNTLDEEQKRIFRVKANQIREMTILSIGKLGVGHIGGAMSIIDILTLLYYKHLGITTENWPKRDRNSFVLSKGHAGPALYCILADKGFFPKETLDTLNRGGTILPSHCDMNLTPGIDMTTGSLGQGLSCAVGMALANKMDGIDQKIYAVIGDGESNEGQIWEAAMAGSQYKLNNLIVFTDYNKMEIDGYVEDVMDIADITSKWLSFGWYVQRVDGHDFSAMDTAINKAKAEKSRPSMIILDTVKGKGFSPGEGKLESHNMKFTYKIAEEAVAQLNKEGAR